MSIFIKIPSPLLGFTNGLNTLKAEGKTVGEVLQDLDDNYPRLRDSLYDQKTGRPFFHIFLNDEDIRTLNKKEGRYEIEVDFPVRDGDQLSIIPPIAGGSVHRQ
ncbi:MAG: MoaD/ThiS family protein [Desulfobacterales bacterium]|jgi:molybdopterin converting factor small subunit